MLVILKPRSEMLVYDNGLVKKVVVKVSIMSVICFV